LIRYRVDLDAPEGLQAHRFRVTLTVPQPAAEQRLSLPAWIPGSYLVREFARHLSRVEARQGGQVLPLEQLDKATWRVRCTGRGALVVSYLVHAHDASVRAAWLDTQRGFFNGTSLFLRVHGREDQPQRLELGPLPRGWEIATALSAVEGRARCFEAVDYDELVDHPVELGTFWRGHFKARGVPHEFVVAGALPGFDGERLLADARRICEAQIDFWHGEPRRRGGSASAARVTAPGRASLAVATGSRAALSSPVSATSLPGRPPFRRYVFLLNAVDEGYGGLEHRASTALIAGRRDLPRLGAEPSGEGYTTLLGLISHEYFHTWNVKRLRPADFTRYDYTAENYTELLWFFEGFTSYYDDLILRRCGLIDEAKYLQLVAKTINQVLGTPGRLVQSVAQASFDAWVKYYRPDENTLNATVSYYTKGSLVALLLDLSLRREGHGSLDEVMRGLWARSAAAGGSESSHAKGARSGKTSARNPRPGGPITEADITAVLEEVSGRSYAVELANWVHGTGELPLREALAGMGIAWSEDPPTPAQRLGVRLSDSGGLLKLQSVLRGGVAERAGLAAGDELVALDGWRLRRIDDLAALQALAKPLPLLAARDQRLLPLTLPAAAAPLGAVRLAPDPQADAAAGAHRSAWLSGLSGSPRP
jgi:predicted metalloprotease with PDZ domain